MFLEGLNIVLVIVVNEFGFGMLILYVVFNFCVILLVNRLMFVCFLLFNFWKLIFLVEVFIKSRGKNGEKGF